MPYAMRFVSNMISELACCHYWQTDAELHIHTHPFYGPLDFVRDYPGEPVPELIWILPKQESEWQWHQLGHM